MEHWESYYRRGALVSCPMDTSAGYTKEVRDTWVRFFTDLESGDQLVDLGTGNGAVALIAKETAQNLGREFEIHGVDLAQIDPKRDVPHGEALFQGVCFHPGVRNEDLPFDDASMVAVCGQYCLEYGDVPTCLKEIKRVLKAHGRAQFILHHQDSLVVSNARESLSQGELVLKQTHVIRKFRRFCEREQMAPARCQHALADLKRTAFHLRKALIDAQSPVLLKYVVEALGILFEKRRSLTHTQLLRQVDALEKELRSWIHRLRDLVAGAISSQQMDDLCHLAQTLGFENLSLSRQMQDQQHLVGWRWQFAEGL